MNRPIKFRAWDFELSRMVYKSLYDGNWYFTPKNDEAGCPTAYECGARKESRHSDPMQFTGRHDKSGREIYEGDIVNLGGVSAYEVTFFNGGFCVIFESWKLREDMAYRPLSIFPEREIIGNKFQNPELLEKQDV